MGCAKPLAVVLVFAACSNTAAPQVTTASVPSGDGGETTVLVNQGGTLEGHTPRGFAGMGSGLFAGDNLNPGFPDGDGVQIYLTFELSRTAPTISSAVLSSDVLTVRGSPFADLGSLRAEPVAYDSFGPHLFDLATTGPASPCERSGASGLTCDVTNAVQASLDAGATRLQFRVRFDHAGDGDGQPDLAMFFITDSNTNEPGIFNLTLES